MVDRGIGLGPLLTRDCGIGARGAVIDRGGGCGGRSPGFGAD